jgi:hypothetical protein
MLTLPGLELQLPPVVQPVASRYRLSYPGSYRDVSIVLKWERLTAYYNARRTEYEPEPAVVSIPKDSNRYGDCLSSYAEHVIFSVVRNENI